MFALKFIGVLVCLFIRYFQIVVQDVYGVKFDD